MVENMLCRLRSSLVSSTLLVVVLAYTSSSTAAPILWELDSAEQSISESANGNSLSLTSSDGGSLTITGWSNTNYDENPGGVESGDVVWSHSNAVGVQNQHEMGSLHRSVDTVTADSMGGYDMFLLEFDSEVSLAGLDLNWATGGSESGMTDLSILAWDGLGSEAVDIGNWADILVGNGGGYDVVGNVSDVDLSYFSMDETSVLSSHWLIGAYNPIFGAGGDAGDDGFALASITTENYQDLNDSDVEDPTAVPVPGTLMLSLLGLCLAALAGRKRVSAAPA